MFENTIGGVFVRLPKNRIYFFLFGHFQIFLFPKVDLWSGDQTRGKETKIEERAQIKNCLTTNFTGPDREKLLKTPCNVAYDNICFVLTGL